MSDAVVEGWFGPKDWRFFLKTALVILFLVKVIRDVIQERGIYLSSPIVWILAVGAVAEFLKQIVLGEEED